MNRYNSTFKQKAGRRSCIGPRSLAQAKARQVAREEKRALRGQQRPKGTRLGRGPRMKAWSSAWRFLKPKLEAAGRTRCEFGFIPHVCSNVLTPAHSKKRSLMKGNDIYTVAVACTTVHLLLDERMAHEQMETAVLRAIDNAGGMILPKVRAA